MSRRNPPCWMPGAGTGRLRRPRRAFRVHPGTNLLRAAGVRCPATRGAPRSGAGHWIGKVSRNDRGRLEFAHHQYSNDLVSHGKPSPLCGRVFDHSGDCGGVWLWGGGRHCDGGRASSLLDFYYTFCHLARRGRASPLAIGARSPPGLPDLLSARRPWRISCAARSTPPCGSPIAPRSCSGLHRHAFLP